MDCAEYQKAQKKVGSVKQQKQKRKELRVGPRIYGPQPVDNIYYVLSRWATEKFD
jgi:hypothetical protein